MNNRPQVREAFGPSATTPRPCFGGRSPFCLSDIIHFRHWFRSNDYRTRVRNTFMGILLWIFIPLHTLLRAAYWFSHQTDH
ncbi:hypothetical protein ACTXT7_000733 [Hymenolepis weldensis]